MPECTCGAWVPATQQRCNACGRVSNPKGRNALLAESPKPKKMGSLYQPELPHGGDHVPPWEIFGKPDDEPAVKVPDPPPGGGSRTGRKKRKQTPVPFRLRRRISLHRRTNGTAVFRLLVSAEVEPLESAPFPVAAGPRRKREAFNRFVEELRLLGWRKTGTGGTWFDIELTKMSGPKADAG